MKAPTNDSGYAAFIKAKSAATAADGFDPTWLPDWLFGFQRELVRWAVTKGRAAMFADCGLGKTPMQLVWAKNVFQHTRKPVLILTPLSVSRQTVRESEKFGIECDRSIDGSIKSEIVVTNYERLHHFDPSDFSGVVCDESGILKNFAGATRRAITEFALQVPYRLLATATAAPNDWMELGTSSEALGSLSRMEMLGQYFTHDSSDTQKWMMKAHGEESFWRWVCSWARAIRKPSDLGFTDGDFILPPMSVKHRMVDVPGSASGFLFAPPAMGIQDQRREKKRTLAERCRLSASLVNDSGRPAIVWCHLNDEGNALAKLIPDSVQVAGSDSDDKKEDRFDAFIRGDARVLITKPRIGGWGLNFQHCSHVVTFPTNSFESYYQTIRRCWRFGQKSPVTVDIVMSSGDMAVMDNMQRKEGAASKMFDAMVSEMASASNASASAQFNTKEEIPSWL